MRGIVTSTQGNSRLNLESYLIILILPYVAYEQLSLKGSELGGNNIIASMQIKRDVLNANIRYSNHTFTPYTTSH